MSNSIFKSWLLGAWTHFTGKPLRPNKLSFLSTKWLKQVAIFNFETFQL